MMEIYGTIHFKLILPHFPGFQQEPLPTPVCSHSPDCKDCPYRDFVAHKEVYLQNVQAEIECLGDRSCFTEEQAGELLPIFQERLALYDVKRAAAYYLAIRGSFSGTINSFGVKGLDVERFLKLFPPVSARLKDVPLENKNALQLIRERDKKGSLTMLLSTQPSLEILALDSRESFQRNKEYYLRRLEEETEPAVRELLERDMAHLDAIQFSSASSRKFVLVLPLDEKAGADEGALRQLEKAICDHGLRVRLAEEQDVKRLLAIYYRQDLTTEVFRDFDGEEYMAHG